MADIDPALPAAGELNSIADPKTRAALQELVATINSLQTANLEDGAVTAAKLATDAVTNAKIGNAAVTSPELAPTGDVVRPSANTTLSTSTADVTGCSLSITPTVASYLLVTFFANVSFPAALRNVVVGIYADGTLVTNGQLELQNQGAAVEFHSATNAVKIPLTAAAHTIKLRASQDTGTDCAVKSLGTGFSYVLIAQ